MGLFDWLSESSRWEVDFTPSALGLVCSKKVLEYCLVDDGFLAGLYWRTTGWMENLHGVLRGAGQRLLKRNPVKAQ